MANNIIEVKHLKKRFKQVEAVKDISFRVVQGELFCLLRFEWRGQVDDD